jgi:hypothetical protein
VGYNYANLFLYSGIPETFGDEGEGEGMVNVMGSEMDPQDICDDDDGCTYLETVGTHQSSDAQRYLASLATGDYPPGVYTVLWHNWGYYDIGIETTSAAVAYYW